MAIKLEFLRKKDKQYHPFNNVILKTPDGTTQIDHILISPWGIFVIETKDLKGWIFGSTNQKKWTQSLFGRHRSSTKYQFQNPLHQNYKHVKAVQNFVDVNSEFIFNVVVFTGRSEFKTSMPENVVKLRNFSAYIKSYAVQILSDEDVSKFVEKFSSYIKNSSIDKAEHIKNIEQNSIKPICPKCGKPMILRTSKRGLNAGSQFWGCPNFPACKMIKNIF